jgi:redox-sensitive bicupin YhaK (pirin superfamily)
MYHGEIVPGFPQHPHRGFETVTVVRRGLLRPLRFDGRDRALRPRRRAVADRRARHPARRDVPAARRQRDNPLELFQIWLNLPIRDKMAEPYFSMLWSHTVPKHVVRDSEGAPSRS